MYNRLTEDRLIEMASIGNIGQLKIVVYTDHNPPHFHVIKNNEFEVKIDIKSLSVIDYKFQKNGKEISSSDMNNLRIWLIKPHSNNKKITNYEVIKLMWKALNVSKKI